MNDTDQQLDKFLTALSLAFEAMDADIKDWQKILGESSLTLDDEGFLRYVLPNYFLYTLSDEEVKRGEFGDDSHNETVIHIADDRYFVVVAC